MKKKTMLPLAATAIAAAFAVTLTAAPPAAGTDGSPKCTEAARASHDGARPEGHHAKAHRGGPSAAGEPGDRLDRMIAGLQLTPEQVAAVRSERDQRADEVRALRDQIVDARTRLRALGEDTREAVLAHLTDEQKATLAEHREARPERGPRGEGFARRGGPPHARPGAGPDAASDVSPDAG